MLKFGRNYNLVIGTANPIEPIQVTPPFTLEFDVVRSINSTANHFSLRLFNLGVKTRNKVRVDRFKFDLFRPVSLAAGYQTQLAQILKGNIQQCWSYREGNNMVTTLVGTDFGFAFVNGVTSVQYVAGTSQQTIINDLVKSLNAPETGNVATGAIGNYPGTTSRGSSFNGNTTDLLRELTGGGFFIDLGTAHCLQNNECLDDQILIVNSQSGLLGTPLLEETVVYVDILFEPKVKVGQRVLLESLTETRFNGVYKVIEVHHKGVISTAVNGPCTTSLGLLSGTYTPANQVFS